MTTTENYVYRFEAALDPAVPAYTSSDLLDALGVTIEKTHPKWPQLVETVEYWQGQGHDFNQGRASLALLCQEVLSPVERRFRKLKSWLCANDRDPEREEINIEAHVDGRKIRYSEIVRKNAEIAFPHILKNALANNGFSDVLAGIRVEDGNCAGLFGFGVGKYRSLLYFRDHYRQIGWWNVGVGRGPLEAIFHASFEGYRFALDARRLDIPVNEDAAACYEEWEFCKRNPKFVKKYGCGSDLFL